MDGFGYGGFSQPAHPYWPPPSNPSSNPSASAPAFMMSRPVESYGPTEELSGPINFYDYSHRSPEYWPLKSSGIGVIRSQSNSSSFYADNTRPGSCGSRVEDSCKGMFSPSGVFTSREVSSVGAIHANDNVYEKHRSQFFPTDNSATYVPGFSSTIVQTCYSPEPPVHPHQEGYYYDFEAAQPVSSYLVEPGISNNAPLPLSKLEPRASFDDTQIRFHLGYGEPLSSNSSVSKDVSDNYLGIQSSLQSSCIAPVNFDALLGSGKATGHSKPLSSGSVLQNPLIDSPCWRGPCASQYPAFDIMSPDSLIDYRPEGSSGASLSLGPKASVGDVDKDALGSSSKIACENSKANESSYWDHFMVSASEGSSASKLLSKESQPCDALTAEFRSYEPAVGHITHLSDNANKPSGDDVVQGNPEPCKNREHTCGEDKMNVEKNSKTNDNRLWDHFMVSASQVPSASKLLSKESQSCDPMRVEYGKAGSALSHTTCLSDNANQPSEDDVVQANQEPGKSCENYFSEDKMNLEKNPTLLTDVGLKDRRSEANDVPNCASPGRHVYSLRDLPCPTSSPKVSSVVNAMHYLSELLVYECTDDGSRLKLEELETLEKVVTNLTKCLKENTKRKTAAGEASVLKQALSTSSPNTVQLSELPKVGTADFNGHYVKPLEDEYGGYAFTETVNTNEMTQNIKGILVSNFPDDKVAQPQALLFKNLWLEAEAALCSTTYMARFHRIRNEIENLKLLHKDSSTNASSSVQEPSPDLRESVPIMKNGGPRATVSLVVDEISPENNVVTMNDVSRRSWGLNSDAVESLLAFVSGIPSALPEKTPISNTNSHVNDVIERFQILKRKEVEREHGSLNSSCSLSNPYSYKAIQQTDIDENQQTHYSPDNVEASGATRSRESSSLVNDVMERFQILKRREADHVQKSLDKLDSDSGKAVEPAATAKASSSAQGMPTQDSRDSLEAPVMARLHILKSRAERLASETCEGTDDVREDESVVSVHGTQFAGRGYESPSEWEHVLKDEVAGQRG